MLNEDKKQTQNPFSPKVTPFTVDNPAPNPFFQLPSEGFFQKQPAPAFVNPFANKNSADLNFPSNKEGGQGLFSNSLFNLGNLSTKEEKKPANNNQTEGLNFGFPFQADKKLPESNPKPKESIFSGSDSRLLFKEEKKSEEISQPKGIFDNLGSSFNEAKKTEEKSQPSISGDLFKEEKNPAEKSQPKDIIFSAGNSASIFSKTPQSSSLFGDIFQSQGSSGSSNLFSAFPQNPTQNQAQTLPKQEIISKDTTEEKNPKISGAGGASSNPFNFLTNPQNQSYAPVFQNLPNESKETSEKIEQPLPVLPKFGQSFSFGQNNETKGLFSQNPLFTNNKQEESKSNATTGLHGIPMFQSNKKEDDSVNEKPMKKQKTKNDDLATSSRERLEESKSSTFSFQNHAPSRGSEIKRPINDTPLMQSLEIEPLRFEHELKKPDRELDTWEDSEIFSKFPKYFEENRQEIEKLKQFRSKAWQEIKNIYPANRVKKYKGLFEEFLKTIDELDIDSEDKNKILRNLEEILLFYENEVLSKPRALEDFNFYYKENQEKSLVFEELPKENEALLQQITDLQNQIILKKAELAEKRKILPTIEIEKNEMVEKVSKDLEEARILNKKVSEDLQNVINGFDKNSNSLLSKENEIKWFQEQKDPRPLHLMIQDTMNEIKILIGDKLEPLQKQYIFYKLFVARLDSKIKKLENKSEELSGIIEKYQIALENNRNESKKISQEVKNIEQEKLRIEEIKKMVSLKHEVEKDTWNILYQENVVLLAKKEEQEAKATEEREKNNMIQEKIRKKQNDSILQFKIKKNRIENLKKEINELAEEEQVDDESVGKIKSEVEAMRQQIEDFEIERKEALNNKKTAKNSCLEITLFILILVLVGMVLFKFLNFLE